MPHSYPPKTSENQMLSDFLGGNNWNIGLKWVKRRDWFWETTSSNFFFSLKLTHFSPMLHFYTPQKLKKTQILHHRLINITVVDFLEDLLSSLLYFERTFSDK